MNIIPLIEASTAAETSADVSVGDGESKTFQAAGLATEVVDIQVKIADDLYVSIADAQLTANNIAQRMLGPAVYRVSKASGTESITVSCTAQQLSASPRSIKHV